MSGFDAAWLALREAADTRARADFAPRDMVLPRSEQGSEQGSALGPAQGPVPAPIPTSNPVRAPLRILDLATGTGANLRYLAPRLGGDQEWLLTDRDRDLLDALPAAMAAWAGACGYRLHGKADATAVTGPGFRCRWRRLQIDLARDLGRLPIEGHRLVTASALLDLVSAGWVEALSAGVRAAGASVLFALTFDGRLECTPALADDAWVFGLLNRHQRTDKGFGPALGPTAAARAAAALARRGYRVECRSSDWRIAPAESALQEALLRGCVEAARALEPGAARRLEAWWHERMESLGRGESRILVGHRDLAATLPATPPAT